MAKTPYSYKFVEPIHSSLFKDVSLLNKTIHVLFVGVFIAHVWIVCRYRVFNTPNFSNSAAAAAAAAAAAKYAQTHTHTHVRAHTHLHTHTHVCVSVCHVRVCVYILSHTQTLTQTLSHTHTHAHAHAHTHTHTHSSSSSSSSSAGPAKAQADLDLEEWADRVGIERHVEIAHGPVGRGLFATKFLAGGEAAVRVPLSATLCDDHLWKSGMNVSLFLSLSLFFSLFLSLSFSLSESRAPLCDTV